MIQDITNSSIGHLNHWNADLRLIYIKTREMESHTIS